MRYRPLKETGWSSCLQVRRARMVSSYLRERSNPLRCATINTVFSKYSVKMA